MLVFTTGVVEGRAHSGKEYGVDRRVGLAGPRPTISRTRLRRLVEEIMSSNAGKRGADASPMLLRRDGAERRRHLTIWVGGARPTVYLAEITWRYRVSMAE